MQLSSVNITLLPKKNDTFYYNLIYTNMNAVSKIPMHSIGIINTWTSSILGILAMSTTNVMLNRTAKGPNKKIWRRVP